MKSIFKNRVFFMSAAVLFSVSAAVLAAVGLKNQSTQLTSNSHSEKASKPNSKVVLPVVPVRMFEVGSVESRCAKNVFTGTVRARYETPVGFRVGGKIVSRKIEVGQRVNPGDVLFELDTEDYRLQQKSSEANLVVARAAVRQSTAEEQRLVDLRRTNAISQSEYDLGLSARDIALGQQTSAERQLQLANNQLAYCRLVADTPGIVMNVQAESGQVVAAGTPVCVIAQTEQLEAVVDIPENRSSLPENMLASVQFWSLPSVRSSAKLRELSPVADPVTRTYRARFSIEKPPAEIQLGMTATVNWDEKSNGAINTSEPATNDTTNGYAFSVPTASIIQHGEKSAVWLATPDPLNTGIFMIRPQIVQVKSYGANMTDISRGLTLGQLIVSAGVQKLDEAMKVRVWEMQK
ncbi:MAG: efflux RND transporter periplasmic adaptor subunit [Planctomycetota bacterium]|nr:efflux RND transporter periplasmic adaptor subunit [Planctomycetota bacterium]